MGRKLKLNSDIDAGYRQGHKDATDSERKFLKRIIKELIPFIKCPMPGGCEKDGSECVDCIIQWAIRRVLF